MTAEVEHPPLRRDGAGGIIAGVCSGLGRHYEIDPIIFRVGFIAASAAGGFGLLAYALAWALIPGTDGRDTMVVRLAGRRDAWLVVTGSALLLVAALLLLRKWGIWFSDGVVWPLLLAVAGGALIWRQSVGAPASPEEPAPLVAVEPARRADAVRPLRLPVPELGPVASGALLVVAAALVFLWLNNALAPARDVLLAVIVVTLSLTVILAPWWLRLVRGLSAERAERIRSQERAEVAAHLHDSVLQTLALV